MFKIKPIEKKQALVVLVLLVLLNLLLISKFADFIDIMPDNYKAFIRLFRVSGFDPIT